MTNSEMAATPNAKNLVITSTFAVEEMFWGYAIRSGLTQPFTVVFGQAISFFFGVCFAIAALGILLLPALFFDGSFSAMRVGSAALFGAMSAYLLWFASRGTQTEVHVDVQSGEIREVIMNRAGQPTTVGLYAFDEIGGIFVDPGEASELSQLVLQYRSTSQVVYVAEGSDAQLTALRDRMGRDLLGLAEAA